MSTAMRWYKRLDGSDLFLQSSIVTHNTHDALQYRILFLSPRLDEQSANLLWLLSTIRFQWLNNVQQWEVSGKMACMSIALVAWNTHTHLVSMQLSNPDFDLKQLVLDPKQVFLGVCVSVRYLSFLN